MELVKLVAWARCLLPCLFVLSLGLQGCSWMPQLSAKASVGALVAEDFPPAGTTFAVLPADQTTGGDMALFARHAQVIGSELEQRFQWKRGVSPQNAQLLVLVQYDMKTRVVEYTVSVDVYTTEDVRDFHGRPTGKTQRVLSGFRNETKRDYYYDVRYAMAIVAPSPAAGVHPGRHVWKGRTFLTMTDNDLAKGTQFAAAALLPHIGKETFTQAEVSYFDTIPKQLRKSGTP